MGSEILAVSLGVFFVWSLAELFLPALRSWVSLVATLLLAYALGWALWGPEAPVETLAAAGGALALGTAHRALQAYGDRLTLEMMRSARRRP